MQDKKSAKIKKHYDIQINGENCRIMNYILSESENTLRLITKIRGQHFPNTAPVNIIIPTADTFLQFTCRFKHAAITPYKQDWCYEIIRDSVTVKHI